MDINTFATAVYVIFSILVVYAVALPGNRKRVLHYTLNVIPGGTWCLAALVLLGYLFVAVLSAN